MDVNVGLETKVLSFDATTGDLNAAHNTLLRTFEEYKHANDERLAEIEKYSTSDFLLEEKVRRISDALDQQSDCLDELARKNLPAHSSRATDRFTHLSPQTEAFECYVRKGRVTAPLVTESKALSAGSDVDGGYLVPDELEKSINKRLNEDSPMRSIAGTRQISSATFKHPFVVTGAQAGWIAEASARPQTATSTIAELQFPAMELYACPAATQTFLDDGAVNIERWIGEEVESAFTAQETEAFVNGDGVGKPKGFLSYSVIADPSWTWGSLGYIATGSNGAFAPTNPSDALIDLVYRLKRVYCRNATFAMNRITQAAVRKLKNNNGNYLWQPAASPGRQASLLGFPITEVENMPGIASSAFAIAFGDFKGGYLIVDRIGIRVVRDPYSAKPYILFYTTKRVGGGVQNFEAIKLLRFSAS